MLRPRHGNFSLIKTQIFDLNPDTGLVEIVGDVFAPLDRDRRTAVEIVIKRTGIQIFLGSDAVHIKMGKGHRSAVDIDNAEGWAADRVGTTQPLGNCLLYTSRCV